MALYITFNLTNKRQRNVYIFAISDNKSTYKN